MNMELSITIRQAYSEVDELLEMLTEEEKKEIPQKLRNFFKEEKDSTYNKNIKANIPIKEQNLKKETLAIMAALYLKYWCKDEAEKQELLEIFAENEKKYQEELREKYNPDSIFKNNNKPKKIEYISEKKQITEYKESVFKRIKKYILKILKRFKT